MCVQALYMTVAGICFFCIALSIVTATAAPPKYVGLQYDEIARMVLAPATAPPPGTFADAYQKILADAPAVDTSSTPAPRRGGLFGGLLSGIAGAGQDAEQAANAMQNALNDGTLVRLAYYNGWVRTDNVVAKTATIDKCAQHQLIELNLARKTYKITTTDGTAAACDLAAAHGAAAARQRGAGNRGYDGDFESREPRTENTARNRDARINRHLADGDDQRHGFV